MYCYFLHITSSNAQSVVVVDKPHTNTSVQQGGAASTNSTYFIIWRHQINILITYTHAQALNCRKCEDKKDEEAADVRVISSKMRVLKVGTGDDEHRELDIYYYYSRKWAKVAIFMRGGSFYSALFVCVCVHIHLCQHLTHAVVVSPSVVQTCDWQTF